MSGNVFRTTLANGVVSIATGTVVGDWVDVDDKSELYLWLDTVPTAFSGATLIVTVEREAGNAAGYVTIATFTTVNSNATTTEEETVTEKIGSRVRYRAVLGGTFGSGEKRTWTLKMLAKSA